MHHCQSRHRCIGVNKCEVDRKAAGSLGIQIYREVFCVCWGYDIDAKTIFTLDWRSVSTIGSTVPCHVAGIWVYSDCTYLPCIQAGPYAEALKTAFGDSGLNGRGGVHRLNPEVSSANGTPSHLFSTTEVVVESMNPWINPDDVRTVRPISWLAWTNELPRVAISTRDNANHFVRVFMVY